MASGFPILFGPPSFGDEDRDQWIRVLTLFLQDPFAASGVNIGGQLVSNSGWQVPASAISGLDLTFRNNFGIRELNPFSGGTAIANGDTREISDRAGVLFIFSADASIAAIYYLGDPSTAVWVSTGLADWSSVASTAGKTNIYFDGSSRWVVENLTGSDQNYYMLISSMGEQR